ncbi:MAG: hypothetical protein ACC657_12960 [Thiohalomonadales bacterium]
MRFLKSVLTSRITLLFITIFLTACASNISNIKIYSISTGSHSSHKSLKKLTLVGVGNCRDDSVRIRFIDNKIISNSDYSAVAFKPGVHQFTVDLDDVKLNNKDLVQRFYIEWKRVIRNIDLEAGKFYLVCPVQKKNKEWTFWLEERKFEFDYYYKYRDNIDYV